MQKFKLADTAKQDLEDIWDYIAVDNPSAADTFISLLVDRFHLIADEPEIGRNRPDIKKGIRSLPYKRYVVLYRPSKNCVEIVRVLSGYRDIDRIFQEE